MANTVTISALQQSLWSKDLLDDVMRDVGNVMKFVGEDDNNIIQTKRDLEREKGSNETFGMVARLTGDGVTGDDELEGNEEAMLSYDENVAIDQLRNAVRLKGKLDAQKVVYDQIKEARNKLQVWLKEMLIRQFFLKAGGVTNTTIVDTNGVTVGVRALWSNTPDFIPDADEAAGTGARYYCVERTGTASLAAADILTLDTVTNVYTMAKLANPQIQPLDIDGESLYVMFVHPLSARDLRKSSDWKTAQENAKQRSDKNPVFRAALGMWSNVVLLENEFVPWLDVSLAGNSFRGVSTGTNCAVDCARNLLCGRQAVISAQGSTDRTLTVKTFDYDNVDGVAVRYIGGYQKAMFNSKEFGVIAVDAAAAL